MKIFFTIVFLWLSFFTSFAQTDAKVGAVYTLGQIPAPLGVYQHKVTARIINKGSIFLSDLPVTLTVAGANAFTDTKTLNIAAGDSTILDFSTFSPWNQGINTITVSVPNDDDNTNNSAAYTQTVNDKTFSYADNSLPFTSAGFGAASGILLNKYTVSGSAVVPRVKVHVGSQAVIAGNTIYAVVMQYGSIVATSDPHIVTAPELGTDLNFEFASPPTVESDFMVGIAQTANATGYYPVAVQDEGVKTRPDSYYASFTDGSGMTALTNIGRPMINAEVNIGSVTPFNIPPQLNYVIAAWDFTGMSSPATATATIVDTILTSSPLLTRGPNAVVCPGTNAFFTTGFDDDGISTSNNDYFQFTITPKPGDTLSLREIDAFVGNSTNLPVPGVNSQFAYSTDGVNFNLIGVPMTNSTDGLGFYLGNIAALQNIPGGNTITFRYYASGPAASADWGFLSVTPGKLGLSITGRSVFYNKVTTNPVIPTGADFVLGDCLVSPTGSIGFTSLGNFSSSNQYIVELGRMFQPTPSTFLFLDPVVIGTLNSNANTGTINFAIPPGTNSDYYTLRISSTVPQVIGTYSQGFNIYAPACHSQPTDRFRSKASGSWTDLNTWESSPDAGANWIAATLIPDDYSYQVEIAEGHTIEATTAVSSNRTVLKGILRILNGNGNNGAFSISNHVFGMPNLKIDTSGVLQLISSAGTFTDVFTQDGYITVAGKITIGDGTTAMAAGFDGIANGTNLVFWQDGSVFEWNSNAGIGPSGNITYFPDNFAVPTFRLTSIPGGTLGNTDDLVVNGLLEVNTPVTMTGSGLKTFSDGIKGSSVLTQAPGCGKFITNSPFADIPETSTTVAVMQGVIDGIVTINLSSEGMTLEGGITIPGGAKVVVAGKCLALQTVETQYEAEITIDTDTLMLDNADLLNAGMIKGSGRIQFKGASPSLLTSTGTLLVPVSLYNKQLQLGSDVTSSAVTLGAVSNLSLGHFNLNMGQASLMADSANFIVTNDTGRLNRYTTTAPLLFPVGTTIGSYTPVTITNSSVADNIKVRVATGVQTSVPITDGNVDRTWFIGDTAQTGIDLTMTMQWKVTDEQAGFNRNNCYISHYTSCLINCNGGYFDPSAPGIASGTTSFTIQRSGINGLSYPSFIVTSKPFIYTFTGDGDWNNANNWSPPLVAPAVIGEGVEVLIDPIATGQCIRNGNILVKQGGKLSVQPGKRITVTGDLNFE